MKETLCWNCKNATGGCKWSHEGKPVEGWEAEATIIKDTRGIDIHSYCVDKCPEFMPDKRPFTGKEIAKILCIGTRTVRYRGKKRIIEDLSRKGIKASWDEEGQHFYGEYVNANS